MDVSLKQLNDKMLTKTGEVRYGSVFDYYRFFYDELEINGRTELTSALKKSLDEVIRLANLEPNHRDHISNTVDFTFNMHNNNLLQIELMDFGLNYITVERLSNGVIMIHINQYLLVDMLKHIRAIIKDEEVVHNETQSSFMNYQKIKREHQRDINELMGKKKDISTDSSWLSEFSKYFNSVYNNHLTKRINKIETVVNTHEEEIRRDKEALKETDDSIKSLYNLKKLIETLAGAKGMEILIKSLKYYLKDNEDDYRIEYARDNDDSHKFLFKSPGAGYVIFMLDHGQLIYRSNEGDVL